MRVDFRKRDRLRLFDDGPDRSAIRRIQDYAPAIFRRVTEEDDVADRAAAIRQAKFNIGIAERLRFLGERRNGFSRRWCRARDRNRSNRS